MRIHFFQHVPFEGPGSIEAWAAAGGHRMSRTRFFAGDIPPSPGEVDWLIVLGDPMGVNEEVALPWLREEIQWIRIFSI
jgi:GMP synthase-like glutamine amidotransferase